MYIYVTVVTKVVDINMTPCPRINIFVRLIVHTLSIPNIQYTKYICYVKT